MALPVRHRWTSQEIALLRRSYAKIGPEKLARRLGLTAGAVHAAAQRYGALPTRQMWSEEELGQLRTLYGTVSLKEIARRMGRSVSSVSCQVYDRLQLERYRPHRSDPSQFRRKVKRLHGTGLSDQEIADELGCSRKWVSEIRVRLGLPAWGNSPRRRARVRATTAEQLAAAGVRSLAELRCQVWRERARSQGWPDDLRPRAVQILSTLWERGPMTRRELADAIGMPWKGSRKSLVSNDPEGSYLAHLMARGLVVSLGRIAKRKGRGTSVHVYSLPMTIERRMTR